MADPPTHARRTLEEIESLWKERLQAVRERYDFAVAHLDKTLSEQKAGLLPTPDGSFAVRDARLKISRARSEYSRVLRVFADLVLYHKIPAPARLRFGPFQFDIAARELSREGQPVHLQAQPAQVLAALLAHAGQVVTREELQRVVWGTETSVDFERSLNVCLAEMRRALGDSADSPRFIRTLPKLGYQFIASVADLDAVEPPAMDR